MWSMCLPPTASHASRRVLSGLVGVSDSTSSSMSVLRRTRLSTIVTSCPAADRCSAVGHPQKPSPPRTRTRIVCLLSVAGRRHRIDGCAGAPVRSGCPACDASRDRLGRHPYLGGHVSAVAGKRVLVTGGAGFIGSAVVHALGEAGADVVVADLRPHVDSEVRS